MCFGLVARRCHAQFRDSLEIYVFFMLKFQETPRSKMAKKYLPPMDVLREETSSNYAESIYSASVRNNTEHDENLLRDTSKFDANQKEVELNLILEDPVAEDNEVSMNSDSTGRKDSQLLKNINYSGKMHLQSVLDSSTSSLI